MNEEWYYALEMFATVLVAVFGSQWVGALILKRKDNKSLDSKILLGLAHEQILILAKKYIRRNGITVDEYDDLKKYLYDPYKKKGGNGLCERIMKKVDELDFISAEEAEKRDKNIKD